MVVPSRDRKQLGKNRFVPEEQGVLSVWHWDLRAGPAEFLGVGQERGLWRASLVYLTIQSHKENGLGGT